jgi:predicted SnoaL-like aldol condensation-catalyzing enzyme
MHRSVVLGAVVALALVTGIAMIATAVVMPPPPLTPPSTGHADVVRRFYAAVNDVIATGTTSRLHAVVAPHFVEQALLPTEESGRSGLEAYLATLHAVDPRLQLVPEVVAASGDLVVVHVTAKKGSGEPLLAGTIIGPSVPWSPVDVLRIADSTIAERWSQTDGVALIRPLAQASLDLSAPAPRIVTIDRLTLDTGAQWSSRADGPQLLFLEEGEVSIHIDDERSSGLKPTPPQPMAPLSAGQSLVVPAGLSCVITNVGRGATRVVVVMLAMPLVPGWPTVQDTLPPDITRQTLASGVTTDISVGPASLTLAQVVLARSGQLSLSSIQGPTLVAVDSGHLAMVASEPAWVWSGVDGVNRVGHEAHLEPGDGALQHAESMTVLSNVGGNPVVALVLTLRQNLVDMPITSTTESDQR